MGIRGLFLVKQSLNHPHLWGGGSHKTKAQLCQPLSLGMAGGTVIVQEVSSLRNEEKLSLET